MNRREVGRRAAEFRRQLDEQVADQRQADMMAWWDAAFFRNFSARVRIPGSSEARMVQIIIRLFLFINSKVNLSVYLFSTVEAAKSRLPFSDRES